MTLTLATHTKKERNWQEIRKSTTQKRPPVKLEVYKTLVLSNIIRNSSLYYLHRSNFRYSLARSNHHNHLHLQNLHYLTLHHLKDHIQIILGRIRIIL